MLTYTTAQSLSDLQGILDLQKANLPQGLSPDEIHSQGFVTVDHDLALLQKMNDLEAHVIAKEQDRVIAYVLCMTRDCRHDIPILMPMFEVFDRTPFRQKTIAAYHYLVVGQDCVDKGYRGQGVFDACFQVYRKQYAQKYDFAITEIARDNPRSLRAHQRVGFKKIHDYVDPRGTVWDIVLWDWS